MNAIYSSEELIRGDQYRPDLGNFPIENFDSDEDGIGKIASTEFANSLEEEFARRLDQRGIAWQYKPRTFAVEWDEEGNFVDSCTPSFFLPARSLYLELLPPLGRFAQPARKVRLLQQQYPEIRIELLGVDSLFLMKA